MGKVLQTVLAFKQNITGGAFEALAAGTGDSLAVAAFPGNANTWLEEVWGSSSAAKFLTQIRSPRLHDNVGGIRMAVDINPTVGGGEKGPQLCFPRTIAQKLYSSDLLTVEVNGTATNNLDVVMQLYYEDLPGSDARLATWDEISPRVVDMVGIQVNATAGATGNYGTSVALNANDDRLKADTDYALLGLATDVPTLVVGLRGPDTSNFRIGVPGHVNERDTLDWFVQESVWSGRPHIPIVNSNNKQVTFVDAASAGGAVAPLTTFLFAELSRS